MIKVEAVIKPFKLDDVKEALSAIGVAGLTITEVRGYGRQGTPSLPCAEYVVDLFQGEGGGGGADEWAEKVVSAIGDAAKTGRIGDGKIFLIPVADACASDGRARRPGVALIARDRRRPESAFLQDRRCSSDGSADVLRAGPAQRPAQRRSAPPTSTIRMACIANERAGQIRTAAALGTVRRCPERRPEHPELRAHACQPCHSYFRRLMPALTLPAMLLAAASAGAEEAAAPVIDTGDTADRRFRARHDDDVA